MNRYCNNHVAPTQLEEILQTHPAVIESLVFGIKEPTVQELVSAVVVLRHNAKKLSEDDIVNYVNSRVDADYKQIRGRVLFREALPRNTSGKLLRREMRRWAEEEAEQEEFICVKATLHRLSVHKRLSICEETMWNWGSRVHQK